jgi:DNA-binding LacI/PurR family transcriptional regulator
MNLHVNNTSMVPVFRKIADALREKIINGELKCGDKLPTEHQLSEMFNTSRMTLRKGLHILEEQQLIVQKHGVGAFVTHEMEHRHFRVAVMEIPALNGEYGVTMMSELMHELSKNNDCSFIFLRTRDVPAEELMREFQQLKCDGLIAIAPPGPLRRLICGNMFDNIPAVIIGTDCRELRKAGRYVVDISPEAIDQALDYLQGLGHEKIAYISADCDDITLQGRNRQFLKSVKARKLYCGSGYYLARVVPSWYDAAREHVRGLCAGTDRPTAVLCPGALFAYGAWQGIMDAGLRIPEDISIIGFDCSLHSNPHLSTLAQPMRDIAGTAARQLLDCLRFKQKPGSGGKLFPAEILERGSCRRHV